MPANGGNWDDTRLLKTASEVIRTWHEPMLVAARGEYLVKESQIPCVSGQREYLLNPRAASVRLLSLIGRDNVERPLTEQAPPEQSTIHADRSRLGRPIYYTFREGYVQLFPLPMDVTDNLKVLWHFRPGRLTQTVNCWQITTITPASPDSTHTTLGFGVVAPTTLAGPSGTLYDFIGVRNPFTLKGLDVPSTFLVTGGASTSVPFLTSSIPTDLAVGDWVAAAGYSPIPNIVEELHVPVALRTAAIAVGSRQSMLRDALNAEAMATEKNLLAGILAPRSKGNPRRLVQRRWMRR